MSDTFVHGGVTDEDMEAYFASNPDLQLLVPTGTIPETEPVEEPPVEEPEAEPESPQEPAEGEPETPDEPAAEPPESPVSPEETEDFYEFDGDRYPRSQVEAAARFQKQLATDPQLQHLIQLYLAGGTAPGAETPAAIPAGDGSAPAGITQPEIDLDDPSIRALYELTQQQNQRINELQTGLTAYANMQQQQQKAEINSLWETASMSFAKAHDLDANDIEMLGQVAARLGVIPQLMSGMDPITGMPSTPDPLKAFDRALEIAMLQIPEYREREFRRSVHAQQDESAKRKLLGAVGGSSGSVTRRPPAPRPGTPEAKQAMLAEVGEMIQGNWSDPTAN